MGVARVITSRATASSGTTIHLHAVRLSDNSVRYLLFERVLPLEQSGQSTAALELRLYVFL